MLEILQLLLGVNHHGAKLQDLKRLAVAAKPRLAETEPDPRDVSWITTAITSNRGLNSSKPRPAPLKSIDSLGNPLNRIRPQRRNFVRRWCNDLRERARRRLSRSAGSEVDVAG